MTLDSDLKAAGLPVQGNAVEGATVLWTRALTPTELDLAESIINPDWWDAEQMRREYQAALTNLKKIEDATSLTNAEALAAFKLLARIQRRILKMFAASMRGEGAR